MNRSAPSGPVSATDRVLTTAGIFLTALVASWYFVNLRYRLNQEFPLATLQSFLDGTAYKPFQFRMLVPWMVGGLSSFIPADPKTLYQWIDVAAVLGLFYAFRYHLKSHFQGAAANVLPFLVFYSLPWNYLLPRDLPLILPYDLAAVALFTLGLALLQRRRWTWYYLVFAVATLNRETILFLTLIFAIVEYQRLPRGAYALHLAAQLGLWLGIKLVMGSVYAANPGSSFEFYHVGTQIPHWQSNLKVLTSPPHLIPVLSSFGFAWLVVAAGWKRLRDSFTRKSLWAIPPFLLMVFVVGNLNEIRVYGELTPIVLTAAILILADLLPGDHSRTVSAKS